MAAFSALTIRLTESLSKLSVAVPWTSSSPSDLHSSQSCCASVRCPTQSKSRSQIYIKTTKACKRIKFFHVSPTNKKQPTAGPDVKTAQCPNGSNPTTFRLVLGRSYHWTTNRRQKLFHLILVSVFLSLLVKRERIWWEWFRRERVSRFQRAILCYWFLWLINVPRWHY